VNLDNFKKNFGSNKISTSVSNISKSNYNFIVSKNKIIATKPSLETQPNQEIVKESNSVNESALTEENTESGYGINETANFSDYVPSFKVAQLPRFINRVNPIYPETEKLSGKESEVLAEVYIDEKGNPRKVVILRSGGELFDKSVIDAVSKSKFSPAITTDGKIIPVRIRIPFKFELD
jgi:protein TonB